ncbi:MAG: DUF1501 domain-containing protein [Acidobacteria bacterium]|nr:DUF1501 domain-containing protein [Acidobacteriota bacterium]
MSNSIKNEDKYILHDDKRSATRADRELTRFVEKNPRPHVPFWSRPTFSRRHFFQVMGSGVSGYALYQMAKPMAALAGLPVSPMGTAKNCIFIQLTGAPSHSDTFDLKEGAWTPASLQPTTINGIRFPRGLMPNIADRLGDIAIVRSMRSWALVHTLGQSWIQIGRNPTSALGSVAPHIGAIVANEKEAERRSTDIFPGFISFNAQGSQVGAGYLSANYAPFIVAPRAAGLRNTTNVEGQVRLDQRLTLMHQLDDPLRVSSPLGQQPQDMEAFYDNARSLMYNQTVQNAFAYTAAERTPYGTTAFGDACMLANKVLRADQGTRFVQITTGGWDTHSNIYGVLPGLTTPLDRGLARLIDGLKADGLFDQTLIVMAGEFGRTVGTPNNQAGRDHFLQQFAVLAGGGIKGGRVIGTTDATASATVDPGWSRGRDVRAEDIEATIYDALGINWTKIRYDDPLKRGFEYVPFANYDIYGPIRELF